MRSEDTPQIHPLGGRTHQRELLGPASGTRHSLSHSYPGALLTEGPKHPSTRAPHDAVTPDRYALASQTLGLFLSTACSELAVRAHNPPPGQAQAQGEYVSHGPGCSRITGSCGDLTIGDYLSTSQAPDDCRHGLHEWSVTSCRSEAGAASGAGTFRLRTQECLPPLDDAVGSRMRPIPDAATIVIRRAGQHWKRRTSSVKDVCLSDLPPETPGRRVAAMPQP